MASDLWIINNTDNTVSKLSNRVVVATVSVGSNPSAVCTDLSGNVWVSNRNDNTVKKIVGTAITNTISVGAGPSNLCADTSGAIWVCNYTDSTVSKIINNSVAATISLSNNPLACFPDKYGNVWVMSSGVIGPVIWHQISGTSVVYTDAHDARQGSTSLSVKKDASFVLSSYDYWGYRNIIPNQTTGYTSGTGLGIGCNCGGSICVDTSNTIWMNGTNSKDNLLYQCVNNSLTNTFTQTANITGLCADSDGSIWMTLSGLNNVYRVLNGTITNTVAVGNGPKLCGDPTGVNLSYIVANVAVSYKKPSPIWFF